MQKTANTVIIGGGIIGCAMAYELALRGMRDIVVLEKRYLCSGATGRCGAGVRQQWGMETNAILARDSIKRFEHLNEELDYDMDIEFKQGGYLIVAYSEAEWNQFQKNLLVQHRLGIPSQALTAEEARKIVPYLNKDGLLGATFCATDGHANPFRVVDAYAKAARRLGVTFETHTEATGFKVESGRIKAVQTTKGDIDTPLVINATNAYAPEICKMAGYDSLPVYPERHQILVTEAVEPCQGPMVLSFKYRCYAQQTPHGSFLMGVAHPDEPRDFNTNTSWQFLEDCARQITGILPMLKDLRVVRQWAGLYDVSPDHSPILDEVPGAEGMWVLAGFSGHGFMIAPQTTVLVAQKIMGEACFMPIERFSLDRFRTGALLLEPAAL